MIKLKKLIKESVWDRKFGEPLPTLKDVTEKHQSKKKDITEKAEFSDNIKSELPLMKERMKKAAANYHNWSISANEFLWEVDTRSGDGKKLKKMIENNRFSGANSGKKINWLMENIYKQAEKEKK